MKSVGIVCEYNPFHLGHLYHLQKSRELAGEEAALVCLLSGDFVQRGEAALYDKFARAEAACRCGADLVLELPLPWCLASAEGFARGAVALLGAVGVSALCFGSEAGELAPLKELARALLEPETVEAIKAQLAQDPSLSFAAARQRVLETRLGAAGALLAEPNNILAVEYLKAITGLALPIRPLTVRRLGAGHDACAESPGPRSASQLRLLRERGEAIGAYVPEEAEAVYAREREAGRELRDRKLLETALLSRLRGLREDSFSSLPDAAGGLGDRILRAAREEGSLEAVYTAAASKRYPLARVRRLCLAACLGVEGLPEGAPPYARVLAANGRGRALLRELAKSGGTPLVTKPAAVKKLPAEARAVFALGADAHDLYVLGYGDTALRRGGEDWRRGPFLL